MNSTIQSVPIEVLAHWLQAGDIAMLYLCGNGALNAKIATIQELVITERCSRGTRWPNIVSRIPHLRRFKWLFPSGIFWLHTETVSLLPLERLPKTLEELHVQHEFAEESWREIGKIGRKQGIRQDFFRQTFPNLLKLTLSSNITCLNTSHILKLPSTLTSINLQPSHSITPSCVGFLPPNLVDLNFRIYGSLNAMQLQLLPRSIERMNWVSFPISLARYLPSHLTHLTLTDIHYDGKNEIRTANRYDEETTEDSDQVYSDEGSDTAEDPSTPNLTASLAPSAVPVTIAAPDPPPSDSYEGSKWRYIADLPDSIEFLSIGAFNSPILDTTVDSAMEEARRSSLEIPFGLKWPLSLTSLEIHGTHLLDFHALPRTLLHLKSGCTVYSRRQRIAEDEEVDEASYYEAREETIFLNSPSSVVTSIVDSFASLPPSLISLHFFYHINLTSPSVLSTLPASIQVLKISNISTITPSVGMKFLSHLKQLRELVIATMGDEESIDANSRNPATSSSTLQSSSMSMFSPLSSKSLTTIFLVRYDPISPTCIMSLPRCLLHLNAPIAKIESHHLLALPPNLFSLCVKELLLSEVGVFPKCLVKLTCEKAENARDKLISQLPRTVTHLHLPHAQKLTNECIKMMPPNMTDLEIASSCWVDKDCFSHLPKTLVNLRLHRRLHLEYWDWAQAD